MERSAARSINPLFLPHPTEDNEQSISVGIYNGVSAFIIWNPDPSNVSVSTSNLPLNTSSREVVTLSESTQPPNSQYTDIDDGFVVSGAKGLIGTRRGLVRLLLTDTGNLHFKKALLTSYKAFITADELLQLLLEEFQFVSSLASNIEEQTSLNHSVVVLFKTWLDEISTESHNKVLLEKLHGFVINFAESIQESTVFQTSAQDLIQLIDTHINDLSSPSLTLTSSISLGNLTTTQHSPDISPRLLGKAFTYIATRHYQNIKETDYFDWLEDPNTSNAVSLVIAEERKLCFWVQRAILRPHHYSLRRENLIYLLDVVKTCIDLGNFASACSLLNGLASTSITDLKRTYSCLDKNKRKLFKEERKLVDLTDNFKTYRTALSNMRRKCVPWLRIHLYDLKMRHRGDPIFVDEQGRTGLINFGRCCRIHMFVEELLAFEPAMDVDKDHSDIAVTVNLVVKELNELVIDTKFREWLQKRSQTLKCEEQVDFDELREEAVAAGMMVSTRIPSAGSVLHPLSSASQTSGEETTGTTNVVSGNMEGPSRSIIPGDPFSRNSARCLDGRITDVSKYAEARGGFSDIYSGDLDGLKVAIKVIRYFDSDGRLVEDERLLKRLTREYMSWTWVSHPIILRCLGFAYDVGPGPSGIPRLISPWMSAGTINHYMRTRPSSERLRALVDVADGLAFLHGYLPSIIHGDIRGGNILMSDTGRPCLSDFGLSKVLREGGMTATKGLIGTIQWMSPELLKDDGFPSAESDVWAYAMTVLEVMSGQIPYAQTKNIGFVVRMITQGELPMRPEMNTTQALSDEIWAVCQKCWIFVPRQRPSMREVYEEFGSLHLNSPDI